MARPNILVIMADEHAGQCTGFQGHPHVRTPNLDKLAASGVTFDRAYCNSPLCVPSRMSFLTGREVSRIGSWDLGVPLPSDAVTWAHVLRAHGYEATLAGKMHFIGPDQMHGFSRRLGGEIEPTWIRSVHWDTGAIERHPNAANRVREAGPGRRGNIEYDDATLGHALQYLDEWASGSRSQPFALCVSFMLPHFPLKVPEEYFRMYYPDNVDMPVLPPGHVEGQHPIYQRLREYFSLEDHTDDEIRRGRAAYYGMITYIDEHVGRLVDQLHERGLAEDTLVVYTSDHGEMMGDHALWWKSNFYEQSVRVPLIFSWPGQIEPGQFSEVVSLLDVVPTVLDLVGADRPDNLDGDSFARALLGQPLQWKDIAISDYHAHAVMTSMRMVRTGRWKFTYIHGEAPELYDLEADPGEFTNLAGDAAYAPVVAELTRRALAGWDPEAITKSVQESQQARNWIVRAEAKPRHHAGV